MPPKPPPGLGFEIVIHMPDGESGESVDDLIEPYSRLVAGASAKERPRLADHQVGWARSFTAKAARSTAKRG